MDDGVFTGNTFAGLTGGGGSQVKVGGGTFSGNAIGLSGQQGAQMTVSGGSFSGNSDYGIADIGSNSSVSVTGGTFGSNSDDLYVGNGGTIALYGDFAGAGFTFTNGEYDLAAGSGSLTVKLEADASAQTISYFSQRSGGIVLHQVGGAPAVPELPALPLVALGLLPLGLIAVKRRTA